MHSNVYCLRFNIKANIEFKRNLFNDKMSYIIKLQHHTSSLRNNFNKMQQYKHNLQQWCLLKKCLWLLFIIKIIVSFMQTWRGIFYTDNIGLSSRLSKIGFQLDFGWRKVTNIEVCNKLTVECKVDCHFLWVTVVLSNTASPLCLRY